MENRTYVTAAKEYTCAESDARRIRDAAIAKAESDYRNAVTNADRIFQRAKTLSEIPLTEAVRTLLETHVAYLFDKEPGPYPPSAAFVKSDCGTKVLVRQNNGEHLAHLSPAEALSHLAQMADTDNLHPVMRIPGTYIAIPVDTPARQGPRSYHADIYHDLPSCETQPFDIEAVSLFAEFNEAVTYLNMRIFVRLKSALSTLDEPAIILKTET